MSSVNFDMLIDELDQAPECTEKNLAILGGEFDAGQLTAFLQAWDLSAMPWRIWEETSCIKFEQNTVPGCDTLLERGRLFGPGGDLALRRDGDRFL